MMGKKKINASKRFGNPLKNAEYQERETRKRNPTLSKKESDEFYKTFTPLLSYVNKRFVVFESKSIAIGDKKVIMDYDQARMNVSNMLWQNPSLFDDYIKSEDGTLSAEHKAHLNSWKRFVNGRFAVVRHQKNGSVFVDMDTEKVYLAKGLIDTIEQLVWGFSLPVVVVTTLLPFKDIIIISGHVGIAYADRAENAEKNYQKAKENGAIITTL